MLELSYTFEPIWSNLLTQCTQCQFLFSVVFVFQVFRPLKVLQKFQKNYIKKSASRKPPESPRKEGSATTGTPEGSLVRPHPRSRQGASWLPCGSPRCPLRLYLALGVETPNIDLFSANLPLYRRRRRFKIGAAWRSCPGTLPGGGNPSGRQSIAMEAFLMCRE